MISQIIKMKWVSKLIPLILFFMSTCGGLGSGSNEPSVPLHIDATSSTPAIILTSTPTIIGTWETEISGVIFDRLMGQDWPITDATITYDVLHTYFAGLQEGRPNQTKSDENGKFSLTVMVHDTDSIRILVEAQGYTSYEQRLTGIDLVVGKRFEIGLNP
jgi:hypothetical protein